MWSCSLDLLRLPRLWPPHPSAVAYCNTRRTKPSADTWAIDPWVRVVSFCLCASLFQSVCVRLGDDLFLVATWNLFVILSPGTACLYSGPSPVDLARLGNHLLHACQYWYCGCHAQDIAVGRDRTRSSFSSIRAVVYGFSAAIILKCKKRQLWDRGFHRNSPLQAAWETLIL